MRLKVEIEFDIDMECETEEQKEEFKQVAKHCMEEGAESFHADLKVLNIEELYDEKA